MVKIGKALLLQAAAAAGGVLCALGAAHVLNGGAFPFSPPAGPEGFSVVGYEFTTVYAPTAQAARDGQNEVQYARARFRALFGTDAPALSVVLVEYPEHLQGMDLAQLRPRDGRVLPFLTRTGLSATSGSGAAPVAEPGGAERKLLAHEACHGYVMDVADRVSRKPSSRKGYGHGALPDWFDESIATLCESPEGRAARRRYLRDRLDQRIPLAAFARMPHPLSGAEVLEKLGLEDTPGQASVEVLSAERIRAALPDTDPMLFYAQALSLGEFIEERVGPGQMLMFARALATSPDLEHALRAAHGTLPRLPATVDALEAEWLRWVARDTRA